MQHGGQALRPQMPKSEEAALIHVRLSLQPDSYRGSGRSGVLQRFRAFARRANARAVSH